MSRVRTSAARRAAAGLVAAAAAAAACGGEKAPAPVAWAPGGTSTPVRTTTFEAGPATRDPMVRNPLAGDARTVANGRALYGGFNCAGCHGSLGGGGIGPPFADAEWIYGGEPENIFQSVTQGRPNGMPAFGGKIPEESLWQIVAYVRSLSPATASVKAAETAEEGEGAGVTQGRAGGSRP